jgi:cyclophilin family peptidyl-prolyl cis-trans isomerase
VRNFLRLCDVGFYDGLGFHRIMREFMVQGGDPTGSGSGNSPFGTIAAEFSEAPERAHGYGVISMARKGGMPDSASCQFFICCDETPSVWGLDGQYASFGKVTSGVKTLEALANVPTRAGMSGENSVPRKEAKIVRAEVKQGAAPTGETIARPAPDLKGEPARVVVQHVLIAFKGAPRINAQRSREEAEALANQVLERARAGEDFAAMARELSDDKAQPEDDTPGVYILRNRGVRDLPAERAFFYADRAAQKEMQELSARLQAGEVTQEQLAARRQELVKQLTAAYEALGAAREKMQPGFGDLAFSLEVGAVGMVPHDATKSVYGWHVMKRLE